ncbi:hypothetical protein Hanom_Chr16g01422651 [Helianthus anomalus]
MLRVPKLLTLRLRLPLLKGRLRKFKQTKIVLRFSKLLTLFPHIVFACQYISNSLFGHLHAELNARKDKELTAKDVGIADLKRRLFEAHDKNESLEIDLEAERVNAETAEEAKKKAEEV